MPNDGKWEIGVTEIGLTDIGKKLFGVSDLVGLHPLHPSRTAADDARGYTEPGADAPRPRTRRATFLPSPGLHASVSESGHGAAVPGRIAGLALARRRAHLHGARPSGVPHEDHAGDREGAVFHGVARQEHRGRLLAESRQPQRRAWGGGEDVMGDAACIEGGGGFAYREADRSMNGHYISGHKSMGMSHGRTPECVSAGD